MGPSAARLIDLDASGVPDPLHCDWENLVGTVGGAMALSREDSRNLSIVCAIASKVEHSVAHFRPSREFGERVDLHLDLEIGHGATAPDNADRGDIMLTTVEHDLFDETPQ
jgi:hypothetical protein